MPVDTSVFILCFGIPFAIGVVVVMVKIMDYYVSRWP